MRAAIILLTLLTAASATAQDRQPGPAAGTDGAARDQLHWIPYPAPPNARTALLLARICRPEGGGPAKLAILNHGSPPSADTRPKMQPTSCAHETTQWFLERGFVVVYPMRRGYGETGGRWMEDYDGCRGTPNYRRGGLTTADDIEAAVAYGQTLPFVRKEATLVVGQSAGGWGTVALASRNPANVAAIVDFAGGRGGHYENRPNNNCRPDVLVETAGDFGRTARRPMLWVFTPNDSYFAPAISRAMHEAFVRNGGIAQFEMLPPFGRDGHSLFFGAGGSREWGPVVERYLKERGLL
jgi:pimeloyl-ACP methyl ester carboxylesterase